MRKTPRETWKKRVEQWARSNLTAKEFAAQIGVNVHTLTYWKYRLSARPRASSVLAKASHAAPSFVEVIRPQARPETADCAAVKPLEVVLPGELVVRVPANFDVALLRRVVDALGGR